MMIVMRIYYCYHITCQGEHWSRSAMSKVSREEAQQNRERVVATAARLFREGGFDGVGIADMMKSAGLTHGGFYAQFPSKEHLMAEACSKSSDDLYHLWCDL